MHSRVMLLMYALLGGGTCFPFSFPGFRFFGVVGSVVVIVNKRKVVIREIKVGIKNAICGVHKLEFLRFLHIQRNDSVY